MQPSGSGTVKHNGDSRRFNGVKTFSATLAPDRGALGERITGWLHGNPDIKVADTVVTQSSDHAFHCLTITVFYSQDM